MINWHDRYAKVLQREPELFDVERSALEVGCGPWGIALWLQRPVVGVETDWSEPPPNPLIKPISGDVLELPFDADAFDFVVCVDALEHLAESDRAAALAELIRVARDKVLVSCDDFTESELYGNNMFVMPWQLFDSLCSTWFPVLEEFCARADAGRAQDYQKRDVSFLSERLFCVWIRYVRAQGIEVDERPIFFVCDEAAAAPPAAIAPALAGLEPPTPLGEPLRAARAQPETEGTRAAELEAELTRQSAELLAERATIAAIVANPSWRLTAPLRSAKRVAPDAAGAARTRGAK